MCVLSPGSVPRHIEPSSRSGNLLCHWYLRWCNTQRHPAQDQRQRYEVHHRSFFFSYLGGCHSFIVARCRFEWLGYGLPDVAPAEGMHCTNDHVTTKAEFRPNLVLQWKRQDSHSFRMGAVGLGGCRGCWKKYSENRSFLWFLFICLKRRERETMVIERPREWIGQGAPVARKQMNQRN